MWPKLELKNDTIDTLTRVSKRNYLSICSWVRPQTHHFIGDYTKSVRWNWVNINMHIFHVAMNLLKNSSNLTKYIVFNHTINGLVNGDD